MDSASETEEFNSFSLQQHQNDQYLQLSSGSVDGDDGERAFN
jgi:hypothetical protein